MPAVGVGSSEWLGIKRLESEQKQNLSPKQSLQDNPAYSRNLLHYSRSSFHSRLGDTNANIPVYPDIPDRTYHSFLLEYDTPDGVWSFTIHARDFADAEAKLRGIRRTGRVLGEIKMTVPVNIGFVAKAMCAICNFLHLPNK